MMIIYTDYSVNVSIIKQTLLNTSFMNKLNLWLVNMSEYLQYFNLNIHYKLNKMYIILDALSQLINADLKLLNEKDELNILYTYKYIIMLTELLKEFKKSVIDNYKEDPV